MNFQDTCKILFKRIIKSKNYVVTGSGKFLLGSDVEFNGDNRLHVHKTATLLIGDHVFLGHHTCIAAYNFVSIGSHTQIAPFCYIIDSNHGFEYGRLIREQHGDFGFVYIGADCWLGVNVKVLPNVRIGDGAVVGAGSVVTHDVEPYAIVVGNPARQIGSRLKGEKL